MRGINSTRTPSQPTPVHMQALSFGSHPSDYMSGMVNPDAGPEDSAPGAASFMVADYPDIDPGKTNFSHKELTVMHIGCSRSSLRSDMNFFTCMLRRIPSAVYVLELDDQKVQNILSANSKHSRNMMLWDQFLGRFIMSAIDTSDTDGLAFMKQLKHNPRLMQSGRALWQVLLEKSQVAVGAEIIAIQARLDAGEYIKHDQTEGDIYIKSLEFQQDFESLPVSRAGENEMMRLYINKLPKEFNTLKLELQREQNKAIVMGLHCPWTWLQLQRLVVAEAQMSSATAGFSTMNLEVCYTQEQLAQILCKNCGGKGHTANRCPSMCSACGLKACGGAKVFRPKCMTIYGLGQSPKNALNEPLPEKFVDIIKKRAIEMQRDGTLAKALAKSKPRREVNFTACDAEAEELEREDAHPSNDDDSNASPQAMLAEAELLEHAFCFACDLDSDKNLSNDLNDIDPPVTHDVDSMFESEDPNHANHVSLSNHPKPEAGGLCGGARDDDNRASLVGLKFRKLTSYGQTGAKVRSGTILDVDHTQEHAFHIRWDCNDQTSNIRTRTTKTDLVPRLQKPLDSQLTRAEEWTLLNGYLLYTNPNPPSKNPVSTPQCPTCLYPSDNIICPVCRRQSLSTSVCKNLRSRSKQSIQEADVSKHIEPEQCDHLLSGPICPYETAGCPAVLCIHCLMLVDCTCVQQLHACNAYNINDDHLKIHADACVMTVEINSFDVRSNSITRAPSELGDNPLDFMIDRGSTIHLFADQLFHQFSTPISRPVAVQGIGKVDTGVGCKIDSIVNVALTLGNQVVNLRGGLALNARRNILSESALWDSHKITILSEPYMEMRFLSNMEDGSIATIPIYRRKGLYFIRASAAGPLIDKSITSGSSHWTEVNHTSSIHLARLWTARLHLSDVGLSHLPSCTTNSGLTSITPQMRRVAREDVCIKGANMNRAPAHDTDEPKLAESPGERLSFDGQGPFTECINTGHTYLLTCVCEASDYGFVKSVSTHTLDTWLTFIDNCVNKCKASGWTVRFIRVDAAPELGKSHLIEDELTKRGLVFEPGARFRHTAVARNEQQNNTRLRVATAAVQRSEQGQAWIMSALAYAQYIINIRCKKGESITRHEHMMGSPPDLSKPIPLIFLTRVCCIEDRVVKGTPKFSVGRVYGICNTQYLVRLNNGNLARVASVSVKVIDEDMLMHRGIPSGMSTSDASTQSPEIIDANPSPFKPQYLQSVADDTRGPRADTDLSIAQRNQARKEAAKHLAINNLEEKLEACCTESEVANVLSLVQSIEQKISSAGYQPATQIECSAVEIKQVEVMTDLGSKVWNIPSTTKDVKISPQKEMWLDCIRKGLDKILMHDGNKLAPSTEAIKAGLALSHCVSVYTLKVNHETKQLEKAGARLCAAPAQHIGPARAGAVVDHLTAFAPQADGMMEKAFLAATAQTNAELTAGDATSAYGQAERLGTPQCAMKIPPLAVEYARQLYAEEHPELCLPHGVELVVIASKPHWGEPGSGRDWYVKFDNTDRDAGWTRAEAVPCLLTFTGKAPDGSCVTAKMIKIVDDFLIMETKGSNLITNAAFDAYSKAGIKVTRTPPDKTIKFNGKVITRDRSKGTLSITMPDKLDGFIRRYGKANASASAPDTVSQSALRALAQSMRIEMPDSGKLDADQKHMQRAIGEAKYIEQNILPDISFPVHLLSKVMRAPPVRIARKVIESIADYMASDLNMGITYGGVPIHQQRLDGSIYASAPMDAPTHALEGYGDATHGLPRDAKFRNGDIMGKLLMYNGGAIMHGSKKLGVETSCVMESEGVVTNRVLQAADYASVALRSLGVPVDYPVFIGCDNKASVLLANDAGSAGLARHFLTKYIAMQDGIRDSRLSIGYVPDEDNPTDMLTKWVGRVKMLSSVTFMRNSRNAILPMRKYVRTYTPDA